MKIRDMAFKPWGAYKTKCDYFVGYVKEASEGTPYLWESSDNKDLQANGQAAKILIDNKLEQTITKESPVELKEGYKLYLRSVGYLRSNVGALTAPAYLELTKNGEVVDSKAIAPSKNGADGTYYFKADMGRTKGIIQIAVHFKNAFPGSATDIATIDGTFQLSDSPIAL